jgi:glycogen synthase
MNPFKILMVGWEYPPHNSGGLGVACEGICTALLESDTEVALLLPEYTPVNDDRLQVYYCNKEFTKEIDAHTKSIISLLQNPYISQEQYQILKETYKVELETFGFFAETLFDKVDRYRIQALDTIDVSDFDVIHAHDWLCFGAGIALKEKTGKPLVVHIHATEFDRGGGQGVNEYVYNKEREGFEKADIVIAVSELTKQIVVEKYGIPHEKVQVVHNGINIKNQNEYTEERVSTLKAKGYSVVLYLGRITIQKGVEYLLLSAQKILQHNPKTIFIIAGSGDMYEEMVNLAAKLGISQSVLFAGFVRGKEQEELLQNADVLVMPSVSEPFGIVPLEAIAQGTPVIISKQSGVSEVVTHALKVDFWDTDEMAHQVISVLQYPALAQTLSSEGYKQVKTLSWKRATNKIIDIYKLLIKK